MNLFEITTLNLILIIFPLFVYLLYCVYQYTMDKKKTDIILYFCFVSSLYLLIRFGKLTYSNFPFLLLDIPLVIAYSQNKKLGVLILSFLLIIYYYIFFNINIIICFIEYIAYYLLYLTIENKNIKYNYIYPIIKCIVFLVLIIISPLYSISKISDISILMLLFFEFIVITNFIVYLFNQANNILSLHRTVKIIEEEKQIKDSLFKITHEIKNPIAVCKGYLDMFDVDDLEHSRKYIPIIKDEINQVLILLHDFLSINKTQISKEIMDLGVLFDEINDNFKIFFKEHNIKFICDQVDEVYIDADYNRLKQVLVNLIKNSGEAIKEKGTIHLLLKINKSSISIIIEDNGCGMSSENLKKVKEAFFTTKKDGTGLGVYLSNEIIKAHNGTIKYNSEIDKGTKVIINIPINKKDIKIYS